MRRPSRTSLPSSCSCCSIFPGFDAVAAFLLDYLKPAWLKWIGFHEMGQKSKPI